MEVSIKNTGELGRELRVTLPAAAVEKIFLARLKKLRKKIGIRGFRPGKVPVELLRTLYGQQLYEEVVPSMIDKSCADAIKQHDLRPVVAPQLENISMNMGEDVKFIARFEVFPEFEPKLLEGVKIEQPRTNISDEDVEDSLLKIRQQFGKWVTVKRAVKAGDRVEVKVYSEQIAAKFGKKKNENMVFTATDENSEKGIEAKLIGRSQGERFAVSMPESAQKKSRFRKLLGGIFPFNTPRSEVFDVTIEKVEESMPVAMDARFYKNFGLAQGEVSKLKDIVREGLAAQVNRNIDTKMRRSVFEALVEKNPFTLPKMLIESEKESLRQKAAGAMEPGDKSAAKADGSAFTEQAEQNVRNFLIVDSLARQYKINVDNNAFEKKLGEIVKNYENPREVRDYYRRNREARRSVQSMALQDMVFRHALKTASLKVKDYPFKEMIEA